MADIQINVGKKDITNFDTEVEFPTYGEVEEFDSTDITFDSYENDIETEPSCIEIEITGLKTIERFIGLADTPLYYDNGKFFKVQDNKIVYADLTWEDISGNIDDNPQLKEYLFEIIQNADEEYVEETVYKAIELHKADYNAHPNLEKLIEDSLVGFDNKIELNKIDSDTKDAELEAKIVENSENILRVDEYSQEINSKLEDFILDVGVDIKEQVEAVKQEVFELEEETEQNFVKTDVKINSTKEEILDIIDDLQYGSTEEIEELNTRVDIVYGNVNSLSQEVEKNAQTVNKNIANLQTTVDSNTKKINQNTSSINNNTTLINQTIENLKKYTKTDDLSTVAFTGSYTDLKNVPTDLATTQYVNEEIIDALKDVTGFEFVVVQELPEVGVGSYVYLLATVHPVFGSTYDEYVWLANEQRFEMIGTTEVDLSNYYEKTQTDALLDKKVDKVDGKSLISDTEIERLSKVFNYDDSEISASITNLQNTKQNNIIAGKNVEFTVNEDNSVILDVNATEVLTDDKTIVQDENNVITAVGLQTKSNTLIFDWVGTLEEYNAGILSGSITSNTRCLITDDEEPILEELPVAGVNKLGLVQIDGKTIAVDDNGLISAISDDKKQDKLIAGNGIEIDNDNIISSTIITVRDWSV